MSSDGTTIIAEPPPGAVFLDGGPLPPDFSPFLGEAGAEVTNSVDATNATDADGGIVSMSMEAGVDVGATDAATLADANAKDAGDAATGSDATDADAVTAGGDGGLCNALELPPAIPIEFDPGSPPPPTGGTIASGVYRMTREVVYGNGATCGYDSSIADALAVSAISANEGMEQERVRLGSGGAVQAVEKTFAYHYTVDTAGYIVHYTLTCPLNAGAVGDDRYSASGNTLTLQRDNTGSACGTIVWTFEK